LARIDRVWVHEASRQIALLRQVAPVMFEPGQVRELGIDRHRPPLGDQHSR
jgi:hypothetical protein